MYHQQTARSSDAASRRFPANIAIPASPRPAAEIIEAQDNERARIARELHDNIGQKIALLQMSLSQIVRALPRDARASVLGVQDQISEIAGDLHEISHELYPSRLQFLGVAKAIGALCRATTQQSRINIAFTCDANVTNIGPRVSLCVYRIVQEAIQNIVKHSRARNGGVKMVRRSGTLLVTVTDFGCGFDNSQPTQGLGMTSMRQRAQLLGGDIAVQSCRNGGTRVRIEIPLPEEDGSAGGMPSSA